MTLKWRKRGQLYEPGATGRHPKLVSHAANPLPIHLSGNIFRVFYSGRDKLNRSSVGGVDIDIVQKKVIKDHYFPFFEHGNTDSFYADGVSIGNCYEINGARYVLFMGWQAHNGSHWRGDIGRLIVTSETSLELDTPDPFMASDARDPISLSYPWVQPRPGDGYDMWYGSTLTWDAGNGEMLHVIRHATSDDGHVWNRKNNSFLPYQLGVAQAFSHPTVARNLDGSLEMWFSYRSGTGEKYRIGYARSEDAVSWALDLKSAGIDVSQSGWDSEMIEYPFVFDHCGKRYMLYNGNGYGKTGFGLAVLDDK